jgi:small subunit ribosomal protein S20
LSGNKSVSKTARTQESKRQQNRIFRGRTRTILKQARQAVVAGDAQTMQAATAAAVSVLDRSVTKGVYHKNKVARLKSRLVKQTNARAAGTATA